MKKIIFLIFLISFSNAQGLWSGWHGICQKGKDDGNWDWLSDPYVLASYAISAYAASAGADASKATTLANQQVEITESALSQAMQTGYHSGSATLVDSTRETLTKVQAVQLTAQATERMTKYAICAARAGLDIAKMVDEYEDDGEPCDPVDEMCPGDGSEDSAPDDGEIFTISEQELTDLINSSPDYADYFEILASNGGVVSVRAKKPSNTQLDMNMASAKEAAKKAKMMMLKIRAAFTVIQTASCVMGANKPASGQSASGSMAAQILSPQNMATMGASIFYDPYAGIAMDVAFNTYASLKNINTCDDSDDAKEKGSRHIATLESKQHGMCHFVESIKSGSKPFSEKEKFRYCCYDDKLTRILVEQAKAQLLKDWQHCTDMTVTELQYIKFKGCTAEDRTYGVDGVKLDAYATLAQREGAYQYKRQCVDLEEFMSYMMQTFGGSDMLLDDRQIKEQLDLMKVE
jgi:hypothetical protein